jgi:hypothetical protein
MLVAGGIRPYSHALAVILSTAGAAFAIGFAVWRTGAQRPIARAIYPFA